MNKRQKKKQLKMRNKALCLKYPWIVPRNRWSDKIPKKFDYSYTELDAIPTGWMKAFGMQMVDEINEELKKTGKLDSFRVSQIKEKYGRLEFYSYGGTSEVFEIIEDYGNISEYVCIRCGRLDVPVICNNGWYEPICKCCYNEQEKRMEQKGYGKSKFSYEDKLTNMKYESDDFSLPLIRKYSCSHKDENGEYVKEFFERDLSEKVKRIRSKGRI